MSDPVAPLHVAVLGLGTMGRGIATAALGAGHAITGFDPQAAARDGAPAHVAAALDRAAAKGRLDAAAARAAADRFTVQDAAAPAVQHADLVIEAASEDADVKTALWRDVGPAAPAGALLASNTSSLSITALGAASGAPERFAGLHFFHPVSALALVELVRGAHTLDGTLDALEAFATGLGKTPVRCDDRPGFLVNRLLIPYLNEAAALADEGHATPQAIDDAMTLGANLPIGPLALIDAVGADVVLAIMETLHAEFGDPKYRPAPGLRRQVRAGRLGRKSGAGYHPYDDA